MLVELFAWLAETHSGFNVFQYLTLRAICAVLTALTISLVFGPLMIRRLSIHQIGQTIRQDGPPTHFDKVGTPTMGGLLILVSVIFSTLLWADLDNRFVQITLFTLWMMFLFRRWNRQRWHSVSNLECPQRASGACDSSTS